MPYGPVGFKIRTVYINESPFEILSTCLFLPLAMKAAFFLPLLVLSGGQIQLYEG